MSRGIVIVDIETVPECATLGGGIVIPDDVVREVGPCVHPPRRAVPANYREGGDAAQRWERDEDARHYAACEMAEEARKTALWTAYRRRALRPYTARPVAVAVCDARTGEAAAYASDDETRVLTWLARRLPEGARVLSWGSYDLAVLRYRSRQRTSPGILPLQAATALRVFGGRARPTRWLDASEVTAARMMDYRQGWALKPLARELGIPVSAAVGSGDVLDAWAAGDLDGVRERCAEDVRLVSRILDREGAWPEIEEWAGGAR